MASNSKDHALIQSAKKMKNVPWCEDYERMISGMLYSCMAPPLIAGRHRARHLAFKYNAYFPDDATFESLGADREVKLKELLGSIGVEPCIEPPFYIDYGCNITIGDRFYSNFNLVILDCSLVKIGHRVMFGPFVSIFAATHETDVQSRRDNVEYARPVTIGDDCWIGGNVTILPGVNIGDGCTVAANSTVTRDIPPFSVAMGTPARVVKKVEEVAMRGDLNMDLESGIERQG